MSLFYQTSRGEVVKRACDFCRQRKIKCDGLSSCTPCQKHNSGNCTYSTPVLKRGPKKGRARAHTTNTEIEKEKQRWTGENLDVFNSNKAGLVFGNEEKEENQVNEFKDNGLNEMNFGSIDNFNLLNPTSPAPFNLDQLFAPNFNVADILQSSIGTNLVQTDSSQTNIEGRLNSPQLVSHSTSPSNTTTQETLTSASSEANFNAKWSTDNLKKENRPVPTIEEEKIIDVEIGLGGGTINSRLITSYHDLMPPKDKLINLTNWPLFVYGIDLVKLILYLNNLPPTHHNPNYLNTEKLSVEQIQAITHYIHHFHSRIPILDLQVFLYFLTLKHTHYITTLLNNLVVIYKFSLRDYSKVENVLINTWIWSLDNFYNKDLMDPFANANFVLEKVIVKLAALLV